MSSAHPSSDEPAGHAPRAARRQWIRHWVGGVLTAALLAGLVALGLAKLDLHQVGHALATVSGGWVALAVALMVGTFLARGESWFAAVRAALPDQRIGRIAVTRVLLIGMAGSTVAPGRVGEAARAWLIARRAGGARESLAKVVGTLVSQTLLNILALTILAIVALAGSAIPGAHTEAIAIAAVLPVGIIVVLLLGPKVLGLSGSPRLGPLGRWSSWIGRQLVQVRLGLVVFRRPRTAVHSASFQLAGWALQWGACYAVLLAFGLEHKATVAGAAAVLLAVNITAVLPLTPSNVGVFQAACIAVLAPFGVPAGRGFAYGLVLQAVEVFSALALGLPALVHEGISLSDIRREARRTGTANGNA